MTEIKKESADGAWLRSTLAELAGDAFPVYDLPSLQVDTNSSIQLSALADRQAAREMRQAASDVEARRLDAARVVEGLKTEAERLRGLIADGKAALRAGEPVSPDAGVASFLLPDIEPTKIVLSRDRACASCAKTMIWLAMSALRDAPSGDGKHTAMAQPRGKACAAEPRRRERDAPDSAGVVAL